MVARALVRLGPTFVTDVPLAIIAVAAFALTVFASASFVLVLLGGGIVYELWTNGGRWRGRTNSFSIGPVAIVAVRSARSPSR